MHSLTLKRRKLWTMSCEALFQNIAASLTPEMLVKRFRKHQIPMPGADRGSVALFQVAHEACHRDSPFARQLQRYFNRKHIVSITQLAPLQPEALRTTVESTLMGSQTALPDVLPGILWAVCSDPREAVRPIEKSLIDELHWLSHCLLLAQFQGYIQAGGPDGGPKENMSDTERDTLQHELAQLKAEQCTLQTEVQHLKHVETRLTQDNAQLQHQHDVLKRRCEAMAQQCRTMQDARVPPDTTPRELKKLQYELAKLTQVLRTKEDETQHLMAIVASYEATAAAMTADNASEAPSGQQIHQPESEWPSVNLNGKTVALLGGLTKAAIHYEQAISQLGGSCVRHDGHVHQGHKKLASIIRQADVVFCPVDCVSHGTAASAKKLCRALDKPCYFLRSSGVSHIRDKLREVARLGHPPENGVVLNR